MIIKGKDIYEMRSLYLNKNWREIQKVLSANGYYIKNNNDLLYLFFNTDHYQQFYKENTSINVKIEHEIFYIPAMKYLYVYRGYPLPFLKVGLDYLTNQFEQIIFNFVNTKFGNQILLPTDQVQNVFFKEFQERFFTELDINKVFLDFDYNTKIISVERNGGEKIPIKYLDDNEKQKFSLYFSVYIGLLNKKIKNFFIEYPECLNLDKQFVEKFLNLIEEKYTVYVVTKD